MWAPEGCLRAIRQDDLEGDDMIGRGAVLEAVGTAGVLGDVPPDGARGLARRIWGILQSVPSHRLPQLGVHHSWLHNRSTGHGVDALDPVEAGEHYQYRILLGESSPGETRAGTARHKRDSSVMQEFDDADGLLSGGGQHGKAGGGLVGRKAIRVKDSQLRRTLLDRAIAHDGAELLREAPHVEI
jgi:hypothetical protein